MALTYLFCFLAGGLLIALAIASGSDGALEGGGFDGGDGQGGPFTVLLGTPFWSFGLCGFGLCGLLFTLLNPQATPLVSLLTAATTGLLLGWGVSVALHVLSGRRVDSLVRSTDLVGLEGRVTLPMDRHQRGYVELQVKGCRIRRPALSASDPLALNEQVIVLTSEETTLTVVRVDDLRRI